MKQWLVTVIFIAAIIAGFALPFLITGTEWTGWVGILVVYIVDMGISRLKWPGIMNTPEVTTSEWMTYAGVVWTIIFLGLSLADRSLGWISFFIYMITGVITYCLWRKEK